jgi:protein ImuB
MRIACIHVPQLSLQCATRLDPSLRGAAVAVVGAVGGPERAGVLHAPLVLACSRAAWGLGVRLGMTATAARALSPAIAVVTAEPAIERETIRAIADALLGLAPTVDVGGRVGAGGAHLAMYAEVPIKTRGQSFGDRVLAVLDELGLTARIGIADDRFTAWVAAAHGDAAPRAGATMTSDDRGVVSVPRGGSAAFLAPHPLSLLAISPEVQHMLEALGVRTLGEFAALPAPSSGRARSRVIEADYQALARGESGTTLRPYAPEAPIREDIVVSAGNVLELPGSVSGPTAVALVARRLALRLAGRGRGAARLEVSAIDGDGSGHVVREVATALPSSGVVDAGDLARVLAPAIDGATGGPWRLHVAVAGETLADGETLDVVPEASAPIPTAIDPLVTVLSTTASTDLQRWALSSPDLRAERREHRRTRRGKQRRVRPVAAASSAQSRLFDRR